MNTQSGAASRMRCVIALPASVAPMSPIVAKRKACWPKGAVVNWPLRPTAPSWIAR